ncbi:hypothetical protein MT997_22265 [Paenibacillus sp. OVF10]|nr:hypothetical protein MT997_22265 [Paenibacillus sp. OVF10]
MLDDEAPPLFACLSQLLHRRLPGAAPPWATVQRTPALNYEGFYYSNTKGDAL